MAAFVTRLSAVLVLLAVPGQAAEARIVCKDGYQLNPGGAIATPYCEDEQLAAVAREHGMTVAASAIRYNPNFKDEVCRLVGHDIRVRSYCHTDQDSSRDH